MSYKQRVLLVIPCYNESKRLQTHIFKDYVSDHLNFLFVNDGSTDDTFDVLNKTFCDDNRVTIKDNKVNQGKAATV